MKLHKYENEEEYKKIQSAAAIRKSHCIWVDAEELDKISEVVREKNVNVSQGICHGVRNGFEVEYLRKKLCNNIFGTEISSLANDCENIIEWDFHHTKDEWINNIDFIYSNSFDHSHDPSACLDTWMSCLSQNGICFIHWSRYHTSEFANELDCFGANIEEYTQMIEKNHTLEEKIEFRGPRRNSVFFVVRKKNRL